ncbi:hypothetical protein ACFQ1T_08545 [Methylophilus glucosoxydans]|uniref:Ice-binding protein C-terminal domain-containing protein n=1 Tax=Methylophilus glucosoxydans TaxID=752553 RepID=A0ABW3GL28_9PROT
MMTLKPWLMAGLMGATLLSQAHAAELIQNGGFELQGVDAYDIVGWQVAEAGILGSVLAQQGTTTEVTGNTTVGAYQGTHYGLLDNNGLASNILYQNFTTSAVSQATLTFQMFVNNQSASSAVDAGGLDYTVDATDHPNQHVRVDILKAGSDPFSTSQGDVLQSLYLGGANGTLAANNYLSYQFDLTSILSGGGQFMLRFASVANQGSLQLGVDNISLQTASAVPEADTNALMLVGLGLIAAIMRRRAQ